jgi:Dephospho-CoA kinase
MQIIGITGTIGAGKGTIVDYLIQQYDFRHYSVRGYLTEEIKRRQLPVNRDSMVIIANDLRANHCPSFIIDELYQEALQEGKNAIIESIRTPGEVDSLRQKGDFVLLAIDAKPEIRYERIVSRNSETDQISFQTFLENEQREMETEDPNKQNLSVCIQCADYVLVNDGDFEALYQQIKQIMNDLHVS